MSLKQYTLLIIIFLSGLQASATHLVGGEMSYRYLGNNVYEFTLIIYRDCGPDNTIGTDFDATANIGIYSNGVLDTTLYEAIDTIMLVDFNINKPCLVIPTNLCIQQASYIFQVTLPEKEMGYDVVYQRCCRNISVQNVKDAAVTGMTLNVFVPSNIGFIHNSSPKFNEFPPLVVCINEELDVIHDAVDVDGDSLVYMLYTPFHGASTSSPVVNPPLPPPYQELIWQDTYSVNYPMDGDPGISINPKTGRIIVKPKKKGKFAMGIAVDEYRNGIFISRVIRDFYLTVTDCPPVQAIIDSIPPACNGLTIDLTQSSVGGYNYIWSFPEIETEPKQFGPSVQHTFPSKGKHQVKLYISSSTGDCEDDTTITVEVYPKLDPEINFNDTVCTDVLIDTVRLGGDFESYATIIWDFGENANPRNLYDAEVSGVYYDQPGKKQIIVTVDQDICTEKDTAFIFVQQAPQPYFEIPSDSGCVPFEVNINNLTGLETLINYRWDMGDGTVLSTMDSGYVYLDTGLFDVSLEVSYKTGCKNAYSYQVLNGIKVFEELDAHFIPPTIQCLNENATDLMAVGNFSEKGKFTWISPGAMDTDTLVGISIREKLSYPVAGSFPVKLIVDEHNCTSEFVDYVVIQNHPIAKFSLVDEILCVQNEIHFLNESTADSPMQYLWDFGEKDGFSLEENPTYNYHQPKDYTISLTVRTTDGCIDTATFSLETPVTVYPLPYPDFMHGDRMLDITYPFSSITDLSDSAVFGYYVVFPAMDTIFGLDDIIYEYQPGKHDVWQIITNQYGCFDSTRRVIEVLGHTLYVPNAFTPNNDGINDGFRGFPRGIVNYQLTVVDRWGNYVFESNNPEEYWLGTASNGKLAKSDVYSYHIKLQEIQGFWYEYTGRVSLLR